MRHDMLQEQEKSFVQWWDSAILFRAVYRGGVSIDRCATLLEKEAVWCRSKAGER